MNAFNRALMAELDRRGLPYAIQGGKVLSNGPTREWEEAVMAAYRTEREAKIENVLMNCRRVRCKDCGGGAVRFVVTEDMECIYCGGAVEVSGRGVPPWFKSVVADLLDSLVGT